MRTILLSLWIALTFAPENLLAQADDVRARDVERDRLLKRLEALKSKVPPASSTAPTLTCSEDALASTFGEYSVPLPRDLTAIIVDGRPLLIKNPEELGRPEFERPALVLPQGIHLVCFYHESGALASPEPSAAEPRGALRVTKAGFFSAPYLEIRARFQDSTGQVALAKLAPNLWAAKENYESPLIPHLLGNYYFSQKKYEVAERKYWQAIRINPCFAISHLNLACLYTLHSDALKSRPYVDFKARALEELHWAEEFNVGDAFGIGHAIASLRSEAKMPRLSDPILFRLQDYQSSDVMDDTDHRLVAILTTAAKYLPNNIERAKLINNKAVYFKMKHKNDLALEAYKEALRILGDMVVQPAARDVALRILDNAARLCRVQWQGGDEEFEVYKEHLQ